MPTTPGIYRWLDEGGKTLYIGKAKNLRKRLISYLQNNADRQGPWKRALCAHIADFDITVTGSDLEALILETNLIKEHRPKYNVLMKDGKNYLFIKVSVEDPYPRVETVRRLEKDGAAYFGPYLSSTEVRKTLDMLQETLQYRACKQSLDYLNKCRGTALASAVPCLECQIGHCNGLCTGTVDAKTYLQRIGALINFLKGNREPVREIVKERMQRAALERKFELAAKLRNYLLMLAKKPEQQLVTDTTGETSDILGVAILSNRVHVVILHRRGGRMIGESHFALSGQAESAASVLEQFLPQFYDDCREVPPVVMLQTEIDNNNVLRDLLCKRRGETVELLTPQRGRKEHLLQLAERNAMEKARQMEGKWEAEEQNVKNALEELKTTLQLPTLPKRIEGFDISHLGGTETVGSMVVMLSGKTSNHQYRSFIIRTLKKGAIDDYAAIREILTRRFRYLQNRTKNAINMRKNKDIVLRKEQKTYVIIKPEQEQEYAEIGFQQVQKIPRTLTKKMQKLLAGTPKSHQPLVMIYNAREHKPDPSLQNTPNLLVIDGGKGQLSIALKVLQESKLTIPVVALAKREEELFVPDSPKPVPLPHDSPALFLLMRLRDEAHRFANRHRERRLHLHLHS